MRAFLDQIATTHRNARAIAMGAGFLLILAWGAYQLQSRTLVETTRTTAVVTEVKQYQLGSSNSGGRSSGKVTYYRGRLVFDDSTWVELQLHRPLPEVGDRVPMIVELYDDGSKFYAVDRDAWLTQDAD